MIKTGPSHPPVEIKTLHPTGVVDSAMGNSARHVPSLPNSPVPLPHRPTKVMWPGREVPSKKVHHIRGPWRLPGSIPPIDTPGYGSTRRFPFMVVTRMGFQLTIRRLGTPPRKTTMTV